MQKSIIVILDLVKALKNREKATTAALEELNRHLADGWRVQQSYGMSGAEHYLTASLVILENDASAP